jgi:folate-binding protein YgfZ
MHAVAQVNAPMSDSRRELTALLAGCGTYRPESALFSLTGRDQVRWLNGMVTNNIRDLAAGQGVYAFVLNAQGHILGDLYVFNRGESLMVEIERAQAETLLPLLKRYIIMDKVEIEDLRGKLAAVALAGPKSAEVLASAKLDANLDYLQAADVNWNGSSAILMRGDNPSVPNFQIWIAPEQADSLADALRRTGAETVSEETREMFRILCGIPKIGQDIRERTLPQETGQERALSFTKGCYIGQEIVERIRARGAVHRTFIGLEIEGNIPEPGTKIQSEGRDVGELTTIARLPLKGKQLALGFLRKEFAGEDKILTAGEARVRPVPLPFKGIFDPSKS